MRLYNIYLIIKFIVAYNHFCHHGRFQLVARFKKTPPFKNDIYHKKGVASAGIFI